MKELIENLRSLFKREGEIPSLISEVGNDQTARELIEAAFEKWLLERSIKTRDSFNEWADSLPKMSDEVAEKMREDELRADADFDRWAEEQWIQQYEQQQQEEEQR